MPHPTQMPLTEVGDEAGYWVIIRGILIIHITTLPDLLRDCNMCVTMVTVFCYGGRYYT